MSASRLPGPWQPRAARPRQGFLPQIFMVKFLPNVGLQAAGNSGSPGPPDPDGPVAAGTVGLVGGGLLRCCARTPAGGGEDDVFGKKWVAVYDVTGAGLRRALHKALETGLMLALLAVRCRQPRYREHACGLVRFGVRHGRMSVCWPAY